MENGKITRQNVLDDASGKKPGCGRPVLPSASSEALGQVPGGSGLGVLMQRIMGLVGRGCALTPMAGWLIASTRPRRRSGRRGQPPNKTICKRRAPSFGLAGSWERHVL